MRVGVNPLSWFNSDIPSLGANIPIEQVLAEVALLGYEGIELEDRLALALKECPSLLQERGIRLVGGWHACTLLESDLATEQRKLQEHIEFLKCFGGKVVILADASFAVHRQPKAPLSSRPILDEAQWQRLCAGLDALHAQIEGEGLVSAYHHHMGFSIQSGDDIRRLLDRTTKLGLLFDVGHLAFAGENPWSLLDEVIERVTHVHAKNVRLKRLQHLRQSDASFFQAVLDGIFTVPGDSGPDKSDGLDFSRLFDSLVRADYKGWVVMEAEQDPSVAHPLTYARLGKRCIDYELAAATVRQRSEKLAEV